MSTKIISDDRIQVLNQKDLRENAPYTLYWMQQSQRAELNHALEFAIQRANQTDNRLLVGFGLTDEYPDANLRHFHFMLEGLQHTATALHRRKIPFCLRRGHPADVAIRLAHNASEVICDRGYLRHQKEWRQQVAEAVDCRVYQVESDAIVPVETASEKAEYAARTIRSKLHEKAQDFYQDLATTPLTNHSLDIHEEGLDISDLDRVLSELAVDRSVESIGNMPGGTSQAKQHLKRFLSHDLSQYPERLDILDPKVSRLSPYLHFGQISPLAVALEINASRGHSRQAKDAFLEQLLVRRELSINFVHYHQDYDGVGCLPDWAATTLQEHEDDEREFHYTAGELEDARTHDPAWNAAMIEMKRAGYLHNHLRMYWGKKIIEWTNTTSHAWRTALDLNNRYFLDGRDANSYASIAWLFGMHDRAHQERNIFGKVRYMSFDGLKRKFDVHLYVESIADRFDVDIQGR